MTQPVILYRELVALGDDLLLFGTLGIAFGPGFQEHDAQRRDIIGKRVDGRIHGPFDHTISGLGPALAAPSQSVADLPCAGRITPPLSAGRSAARASDANRDRRTRRRLAPRTVASPRR